MSNLKPTYLLTQAQGSPGSNLPTLPLILSPTVYSFVEDTIKVQNAKDHCSSYPSLSVKLASQLKPGLTVHGSPQTHGSSSTLTRLSALSYFGFHFRSMRLLSSSSIAYLFPSSSSSISVLERKLKKKKERKKTQLFHFSQLGPSKFH